MMLVMFCLFARAEEQAIQKVFATGRMKRKRDLVAHAGFAEKKKIESVMILTVSLNVARQKQIIL
jgi:hypothetical protein